MGLRVLVAFDSFKDALSAERACEVAAAALHTANGDCAAKCVPLSDGGEGFVRVLTAAVDGELVPFSVTGPKRDRVEAEVGFVDATKLPKPARRILFGNERSFPSGAVAIIEMASASGLPLLAGHERNPWRTTSFGTGELMRAVTERGAVPLGGIVLGIGGSGTSDLGLGALEALGLTFTNRNGHRMELLVPEEWEQVAQIDGSIAPGLPPIAVACDVRNPLLGPNGAAAIYGPQKGLRDGDIERFDELAGAMACMLCEKFGVDFELAVSAPGAGAAGGMFFGLGAAVGARAIPGFDLVSGWFDLEAEIAAADIVISGEGHFDATSFSGKAVGQIVSTARRLERECVVFAGSVEEGSAMGEERVGITPKGTPLDTALAETEQNLTLAVARYFTSRR